MINILSAPVMAVFGGLPLIITSALAVVALVILGVVVASRYKRIPPNGIGVFYGRQYKVKDSSGADIVRGFKIITGGGKILLPVVEQFQVMSTAAFQVIINENDVPTQKNVPVQINAVATCRISPNPEEQSNAVQAFLGKEETAIAHTISEILRGHVRSIIASLTVEQILRDRAEFNKKVLEESADEFRRLGIQIITLVVQDVQDTQGYIKALGEQETAAKLRDAAIAKAEAEKETKIKTSNAAREASEVAAQNATKVADAEKQRDIQVAQFKKETETKRAEAEMANAIAKTTQEKELRVREANRDAEAAQAGILVQEKRATLKQKELEATVITEARAEREAAIIRADAGQEVAQRTARELEIKAEGVANAAVKEADGHAAKIRATANAEADATRVRLTAEADGTRAKLTAEADGAEKAFLATASGKKAGLLAEAEGTQKLADALASLSADGRLIMIMDRLPALFDKGGDAGAKMLSAVFAPLGQGLGNVKDIRIVDMGNGGGTGKTGVEKLVGSIPAMVADLVTRMQASGIDPSPLFKLARLDTTQLQQMVGLVDSLPVADEDKK